MTYRVLIKLFGFPHWTPYADCKTIDEGMVAALEALQLLPTINTTEIWSPEGAMIGGYVRGCNREPVYYSNKG